MIIVDANNAQNSDRRRLSWWGTICVAIVGILFFCSTMAAQQMEVPVRVQLPIIMKILPFDRNFQDREGKEIRIGLVYQSKFRTSLNIKNETETFLDNLSGESGKSPPIHLVPIDISSTDLENMIATTDVDILYVTPLRAVVVDEISRVSRGKKITTFTGVPEYVESSLAVGIGLKEGKPSVMINIPAAKAEGANFSAQLLWMAETIE